MRKPVENRSKRRPAHVGALASLPLFFPLRGRKVLLAGGTDAAAWKAELFAASGAQVHVYAVTLTPAFEALIMTESCGGGRVVHHQRPWGVDSFRGMALAVADAAGDGEAKAFACAARSRGIPVNVIDNPPFCDFQLGSIVNRSPVVIGISTNGVAPILGQAIRRRIETLLPPALQDWARLAGKIRGRVLDLLAPGQERRHFWERFSDLAFSGQPAPRDGDGLSPGMFGEAALSRPGRVSLVGAGPGDPEHLTLKAMRALQSADIILFDDQIGEAVLELARREAHRIPVGRRGEAETGGPEDIADTMASLAHQGKHVVRLMAGDPANSGRGDRELDRLAKEGIPVTVVPGVPAASHTAARHGICLSRRGPARPARFVTEPLRTRDLADMLDG